MGARADLYRCLSLPWFSIKHYAIAMGMKLRGLALLAVALLSCATTGGARLRAPEGPIVGQPLPDLPIAPLSGTNAVRLSDLKGKVVLLDIWASWCAPCQEELPMLDEMAGRLRGKGVEVVAVSIDEDREEAQRFVRSRQNWSLRFAHDPEGKVPGKLQPSKMPTSYLIDRRGILRGVNPGFERADAKKMETRLLELARAP